MSHTIFITLDQATYETVSKIAEATSRTVEQVVVEFVEYAADDELSYIAEDSEPDDCTGGGAE